MGLMIHRPHLLLTFCVVTCPGVSGLFEWLRQATAPPQPTTPSPTAAPALPSKETPFEMMIADEKFLAEAKQLELSPLDTCHHKVVARLKSSCESLSEENLAKLGVVLFNCQAETEGRRTFPCAQEMTIKECTADMDSDTWNAYLIVSNRARAVCYSVRQQLFRRRAEQTVNALISTASSQLDTMKDLKEGQLELKELTTASLEKLLDGHGTLRAQQGKLHEGQEQMESSLRENLERLGQEKALIASGQELVAQLIQGITKRMENVSEHLQNHGSEVQDSHKAIVDDLAGVKLQAQDISQKIDHSMVEFLQYQDQTSQYYSDLMGKLERMNGTLGAMLLYLDTMQSRVEDRLHVIQGYLGWAGLSLTAMWTCVLHTGYFIFCAVLLTFLRCPGFSRVLLLLLVPLNAAAEVHRQPALTLGSLSLLLLALSLGHWGLNLLWMSFQAGQPALRQPLAVCNIKESEKQQMSTCSPYPPSSTPQKDETDFPKPGELLHQDSFLSGELSVSAVTPFPKRPASRFLPTIESLDHSTPRPKPLFPGALVGDITPKNLGRGFDALNDSLGFRNDSRSATPSPSVISNGSMSSRQLCSGITKTGKVCKKRAVLGQEYCRVHEGEHTLPVHL